MGAVEPCYPTRPSSPSRVKTAAEERCLSPTSATDLQHEHRRYRSIPASRTLATSSTRVEIRLTPSLQLQAGLRRYFATVREGGAPHRSSAALRRRSRPRTTLEAQPSDASCPAFTAEDRCRPRPRQEACRRRPEAPSIDRCPLRCSRIAGNPPPFHGFAAVGSASNASPFFSAGRESAFAVSFPSLERLGPRGHPGLIALAPGRSGAACRLLQSLRFSSTDHGATDHPAHRAGSYPCAMGCGQPCTSRCTAGQAVSEPGATKDITPLPAPSLR